MKINEDRLAYIVRVSIVVLFSLVLMILVAGSFIGVWKLLKYILIK